MEISGDALRQLFKGYAKRDDVSFQKAARALIQDERAKNHLLLAQDLESILLQGSGKANSAGISDIPKDRDRGLPLVEVAQFDYGWDRLILREEYIEILQQIAHEHHRSDVLAASGLKPKRKILFYGPPGCGKTLAAKVLSGVVGYPLVTVRFDAIVSSLLGETSSNLRRVFDYIQKGRWVVLFDEFDSLGKDRDNPNEHGELKRVLNSLLQMMDSFAGDSILIAATNLESSLDAAIWRRFEAVLRFVPPTLRERTQMLAMFCRSFKTPVVDLVHLAEKLEGASGADVEYISVEAARCAILDGRNILKKEDFESALKLLQLRNEAIHGITVNGAAQHSLNIKSQRNNNDAQKSGSSRVTQKRRESSAKKASGS